MSNMMVAISKLLCVIDHGKRDATDAIETAKTAIGNPMPRRIDAADKETGARLALEVHDQTAGRRKARVLAYLGNKLITDQAVDEDRILAGALAEAEKRARSILMHEGDLLREDLTREDVYSILNSQMTWAITVSRNPSSKTPLTLRNMRAWGLTR